MDKLSQEAQDILEVAFSIEHSHDHPSIPAILRKLAELIADEATPGYSCWGEGYYEAMCDVNDKLRKLADELDYGV